MKSRTKGFTLIELAIVIVILAVISAVAVPKFINISGDARKAKIASVSADLRTAIDLIYYKALILGLEGKCYDKSSDADKDIELNKDQTAIVEGFFTCNGYPMAYLDAVIKLLNLDDEFKVSNFKKEYSSTEFHRVLIISTTDEHTRDENSLGAYCQVIYQPNSVNQIVVLDSGC